MKHKKIFRCILIFLFGIVGGYFLIYAILSLNGSYQPVLVDLNHADYGWVPYGFYPSKNQQPSWINKTLFRIYFPLWQLDEMHIHKNPPPSIYFHKTSE